MNDAHALTPAITLLLVGILAMMLARRVGLSSIVGYLLAGVMIGPHAFGLMQESETTHLLAELGVVFLLFDIGLHFTLSSLWEARRDIFGLAPLQILLCTLVFGAIAATLGHGPRYAVILGGALALSSTAVVVHTLAERVQQNCPVGLTGTAVLIFQDICAIFLLILAVSVEGAGPDSGQMGFVTVIAWAMAKAVAAFVLAVVIGRYGIRPLFRLFAQTRNEEVFTAAALLVVLATAAATGNSGLSLTLGAFLGGMIISETPYRHLIQTEAKPFRNLLLGFFFITVGMSLDWRVLLGHWAEILMFLAVLVATKTVLVAAAARAFGWSMPGAIHLGFLLSQGSEFVFVIVALPAVREALGEATVGVVITGVAASLAITPSMAALGNRFAKRFRKQPATAVTVGPSTLANAPVVVFGMDDVGRTVADALESSGVRYDAVEGDYDRFLAASADGYPVAFGDPRDERLMETLGLAQREAIVISLPDAEAAETLDRVTHERYPRLARFIGVDGEDRAARLAGSGVRAVVNRSFPRGSDVAAAVLRFEGVAEIRIQSWVRRQQERALQSRQGFNKNAVRPGEGYEVST